MPVLLSADLRYIKDRVEPANMVNTAAEKTMTIRMRNREYMLILFKPRCLNMPLRFHWLYNLGNCT